MNKLERWLLTRLIRKQIAQGPLHPQNIEGIYRVVREACSAEFNEDSNASLNGYLQERFEAAQSPDKANPEARFPAFSSVEAVSFALRKTQARSTFYGLRHHGYRILAWPVAALQFLFPYRDYGINQYFPRYRGTQAHQLHVQATGGPAHPWNRQSR